MSLQEVVQQVSYVTTAEGQQTAVQVQIEVWDRIISLLQEVLPAEKTTVEENAAWDLFLSLADDAQLGMLANPSIQHDNHLYGHSA